LSSMSSSDSELYPSKNIFSWLIFFFNFWPKNRSNESAVWEVGRRIVIVQNEGLLVRQNILSVVKVPKLEGINL
jgi:hypothetical protein